MNLLASPRDRASALVTALGIAIAVALLPFATGLLGVVVLYVICAPAHRWLLARGMPPRVAALGVVAAAALGVVLPAGVLLGLAIEQAPETLRELQGGEALRRVAALRVAGIDVGAQVVALGGQLAAWASGQALSLFGSATRGALNLVVSLFGLYYLLLAPGSAWETFRHALPFSEASAEALRARFLSVTEATLLGQAFTSLAQGTIVGAGFWLTGLDNALFWGMVTGLASVMPVVGSALVWLPGSVVLALDGRWGAALVLLAIGGGIAANVDNLIRPMVFKRISDIHPMITLVGAFAGLGYFGLLGVLLGPLAIAYFFELLRMYREEYGHAPARANAPAPAEAGAEAIPPAPAPG